MGNGWHYQVFAYDLGDPGESGVGIHEYYQLEDRDTWTVEPVPLVAESVEELKEVLKMMLEDIDRHGVLLYPDGEDE